MVRLNVRFLPSLVSSKDVDGATAVVIDVLRASTTIVHALAAGAKSVKPCLTVEEAREFAEHEDDVILGGERGGVKISGFNFGNSPLEYNSDAVKDRTVVFTTTNGTKALMHCQKASRILIGSFVNLSAVCERLSTTDHIELICAGTDNEITLEDVLCAGAVAHKLVLAYAGVSVNDQAKIAIDLWQQDGSHEALANSLRRGLGGENLVKLELDQDVDVAARVDTFDHVPEYDFGTDRIV